MEKQQAKSLIEQTFDNKFNKEQYAKFAMNLLDGLNVDKQFTRPNAYIKESFRPYIESYGRIGKYIDNQGNDIEVLWVNLKKETALDRARTMQRNFIAWYLNGGVGDIIRHNALVAFYNEEVSDWRFSFVKLEADLTENEKGQLRPINNFTAAKRYSFLVGEQEPNHTAQARLIDILAKENPVLSDIAEAFNIEKVSKEFFATYKELFLRLVDNLKEIKNNEPDQRINHEFVLNNITEANFCKKLMGQLVFLYFLQKKGWLGVKRDALWGDGDKKFLRSTFETAVAEGKNFFNDYLEPLFYEALANGERDGNWFRLLDCKIPFLNGGLFEPIGVKIGGYDWVNTDIIFDNKIFSNDIKTKDDDIGTGILDVFDRYNFTVKEDEPLEKEVAIDPEMLGKVFEELLEVEDRKSKGAFYTPREIVHYMCQESLINYLCTELDAVDEAFIKSETKQIELIEPVEKQLDFENKITKQAISDFVHHADKIAQNEAIAKAKEKSGDLGKTYDYHLDQSIRNNAKPIDVALEHIKICDPAIGSGAFPVGMMNEIVRVRMALVESGYINQTKNRTPYDYKRQAIQNSIYGVDIDCGAIEIAKLRLWLSLVVDENDIDNIKPLPNLDYKIVCGNSLLGVERNIFNDFYYQKLEELKPKYFDTTQKSEKRRLKKEIDEIISELTKDGSFDFEIYFSEVFHEKRGFDVVIGNPPYGAKLSIEHKNLFKKIYENVHMRTPDTFNYFISKTLKLLNKGVLAFIIPNNLFFQNEYEKTRQLLITENVILKAINLGDKIFENADVPTCIIIAQKMKSERNYSFDYVDFRQDNEKNFNNLQKIQVTIEKKDILQTPSFIFGVKKEEFNLISKIQTKSILLEQIATEVACGISSGGDKIFRINDSIRKDNCIESEILKPVLVGREIDSYQIKNTQHEIIYTTKKTDSRLIPNTIKYLEQFKDDLSQKRETKKGTLPWWCLHWSRTTNIFEGEKIILRQTSDNIRAAIDNSCFYALDSILIIKTNQEQKFLLSILNSKLNNFIYKIITQEEGRAFAQVKPKNLKKLLIPNVNNTSKYVFIGIVNKILELTGSNDYLENREKQKAVNQYMREIDLMVYKFYELDYLEVLTIDPDFKMSEQDYSSYSIKEIQYEKIIN